LLHKHRIIWLSLILLMAGLHLLYYAGWTHDDPYITFRYVENVASGKGFVFNEGDKLEGYSNFLFLIMLLPFKIIGMNLLGAAKLMGFFLYLSTVFLFFSFIFQHYRDIKPYHLISVFLLALSGTGALWALSGMETAVSIFCVAFAWMLFGKEIKQKSPGIPWSAIFILFAAMNRPEGAVFFFALLPFLIFLWFKNANLRKYIIFWLILFLIPYGIYNLWRIIYFGKLFPNTFYAKATGAFLPQLKAGIKYIWAFFLRNPYFFIIIPFLPLFFKKRKSMEISTAAALVFAQLIFILLCGGDWMPLGRFIAPVLVPLFFLFQETLIFIFNQLKKRDPGFKKRDALSLVCIILIITGIVMQYKATRPIVYSAKTKNLYRPHIEIGIWFRENVPEGSLLAAEEAGIIPYYSKLPFIDLLGLVDSHIAHKKGAMHFKHDVGYVLSRKPVYILLYTLNPVNSKTALNPRLDSGRRFIESEEFNKKYSPVKSFLHGNELLGIDYLTLFVNNKYQKN
jgi:arabinofuranosyltransferase